MTDSIALTDILIQQKFKELLDARKEKKLYDFKSELKKELETILGALKNPEEKKKTEKLLQEI
ncbi:hypothetical protein [Anaeromicrobium sediminis]|uniref:Uncharacterized protein n=1 Tax=Anaeromicrobium sediminis TaxID=1478221 RepID=A0A267MFV4_9FIRM|nr:hypothetical protein [Anaeromicrobium sediminis]PAB58347.1 hypothetical protein CCE28_15525 [Anaeromicrobium sediminis]